MERIYYNPWLERYKKPFGAVKIGKKVDFWLSVPVKDIASVQLMIRKEDGQLGLASYPMTDFQEDLYHCSYTVDQGSGLYFYYFKIVQEGSNGVQFTRFYGSQDQGGEGKIYNHESEVASYQLTCYEKAEVTPAWYREAVFYQIFPDRFWNGNPDQKVNAPKKNSFLYGTLTDDPLYIRDKADNVIRWDFFGGNLKGIAEKIPYLKELGISALYLNPIFEATSNHRYDTNDYFKIDPMLGTEADFIDLLQKLHHAGISVILDGVFSHVGKNSRYFNLAGDYGKDVGAYWNPDSRYRSWFKFTDYPKEYKSWWGIADLPEVDKSDPTFQEFIYGDVDSVLAKWNDLGIDGWRLDVADELTDEFIAGIRKNLSGYPNMVLIGEVWEDASNKVAYDKRRQYVFGDHLQGVMNYPLRNQILDILNQGRSFRAICHEMVRYQENYPSDFYYNQLNNIGTHDTERILTMLGGSVEKLTKAWGLLFMMPGIPCIYYGDEAGVTGGRDPENRKFFPWHAIDETLFTSCQKWIERRKKYDAMKSGAFFPFYSEHNEIFGIIRYLEDAYTIYLINVSDTPQKIIVDELISPRKYTGDYNVLHRTIEGKVVQPAEEIFVSAVVTP